MRAEGKKTSQGMPSVVCYPQALYMEPIKVLKINSFSSRHQRPGENCGLGRKCCDVFETVKSWATEQKASVVNNKVAILLGAGSSVAAGFPTTVATVSATRVLTKRLSNGFTGRTDDGL